MVVIVMDLVRWYPLVMSIWGLLDSRFRIRCCRFHPSLAQQDLRQDNLNEMLAWAFCYKDTAVMMSVVASTASYVYFRT